MAPKTRSATKKDLTCRAGQVYSRLSKRCVKEDGPAGRRATGRTRKQPPKGFQKMYGTKREVFEGIAYKTGEPGKMKKDLMENPRGDVVFKKLSAVAKKSKHLTVVTRNGDTIDYTKNEHNPLIQRGIIIPKRGIVTAARRQRRRST